MKNYMNSNNTKLILLHPYIQKQGSSNRLWLIAFVSCLTVASLSIALIYTRDSIPAAPAVSTAAAVTSSEAASRPPPIPKTVANALLHYASNSNATGHMSVDELKTIAAVLRQCSASPSPCNLLVFGLTPETLLWRALNNNGRTVFIEENRYYAAYYEEKHPEVDVYDVQYTTKVQEMKDLLRSAKEQVRNECRPVQNLLFSECKLGLNDLPNNVYEVDWDVILVDGPRGWWPDAPGRMASIFTAAVLARSKNAGGGSAKTHVLVHDYGTEVERVCSEEFLCMENLVQAKDSLAYFVVDRMEETSFDFCRNRTASSSSSSPSPPSSSQ